MQILIFMLYTLNSHLKMIERDFPPIHGRGRTIGLVTIAAPQALPSAPRSVQFEDGGQILRSEPGVDRPPEYFQHRRSDRQRPRGIDVCCNCIAQVFAR